MTQKIINTGIADKGNGDPIRTAFTKVNDNFAELYSQLAASVVVGATAPTGPEEGSLWWNSESGRMYVYFGTAWVDASPVDGAGISSTNELVNGAYTTSLGANGVLTLPNGSIINGSTIRGVAGTGELNYTGITIGPNSNDAEKTWMWVDHANAYISTDNSANTWTFNDAGALTFPQGTTIATADGTDAFIIDGAVDKDIQIYTYSGPTPTAHGWTFGTDGKLSTPSGLAFGGANGHAEITNTSPNGSLYIVHTGLNQLVVEWTAGNNQLPVGEDVQTAGIYAGVSGLNIGLLNDQDVSHSWQFAGDGSLRIPGDIRSLGNINIDIDPAGPTLQRWTFGDDGTTTFPNDTLKQTLDTDLTVRLSETLITDVTSIVPGTGYSNGTAATTGGTGTGLTVDVNTDGAGHVNQINSFISLGQGYKLGDVITIVGGNNDAQFTLTGTTPNRDWTFNVDGTLTLPGDSNGTIGENATGLAITSEQEFSIFANSVESFKLWRFGTDGALTLPVDSSILTNETALNIATHSTETYTFDQAYWEALNGDVTRMYTFTGNAQYFSCTVTANQDGTYTVADTTGNSFDLLAGSWFKIPGDELGGATPANDIQITVATVDGGGAILTTTVTGTAVGKQWTFSADGSLTLPIGVSIDNSVGSLYPKIIADSGKLFSVQGQGASGSAALAWTVDPNAAGQYAAVAVSRAGDNLAKVILQAQSDSGDVGTVNLWKFDETGRTTFPNGTVPEHSYGAAGDKEGMVVFTDPYIYYCKQDYVNNTTDIWVRVAWTGTNW